MFYQAFVAYCETAEFAMQIQQEMLRLWVNPWLMAMEAAVGSGRTEPVQTMQKRRPGNSEALDAQYRSARAAEGARIQLREEELRAHKQLVETGEVRVRREVVVEHRTIEVPVQREEVVIERHAPTGKPVGEIRIPVSEEQVTVEKRPVVTEEVTVGKRVVQGIDQWRSDPQIANRAYEIWQQRGSPPSTEQENWLEAERQLATPAAPASRTAEGGARI